VRPDSLRFEMIRSDGSMGDAVTYQAQQKVSICGDANGDGMMDIGDAIFVINYVGRGGQAPRPPWVGDANCDWSVDLGDVVYLLNYLFKGGPEPSC
jgi:hypothetical protein